MNLYDFMFLALGFAMFVADSKIGLMFIVFVWFVGQKGFAV